MPRKLPIVYVPDIKIDKVSAIVRRKEFIEDSINIAIPAGQTQAEQTFIFYTDIPGYGVNLKSVRVHPDDVNLTYNIAILDPNGKMIYYFEGATGDLVDSNLNLIVVGGERNTYTIRISIPSAQTTAKSFTVNLGYETIIGPEE